MSGPQGWLNRFRRLSRTPWINGLVFQLLWWLLVLGQTQYGLTLLAAYLLLYSTGLGQLSRMTILVLIGIAVDSGLGAVGILQFEQQPIPIWLAGIWCAFVTTLSGCLAFLIRHLRLAALLGAIGGPLAYVTGVKLGAAQFGVSDTGAILMLALVWAVLLPALLWLNGRLRR